MSKKSTVKKTKGNIRKAHVSGELKIYPSEYIELLLRRWTNNMEHCRIQSKRDEIKGAMYYAGNANALEDCIRDLKEIFNFR